MQTLGNGAMFMEGLGMMGQAALGSAQAMAQNVTNLITNDGQKGAQVRQQRMNRTGQGMTGTSMGGPNITGNFVGPDPSAPSPRQSRTAEGPSRVTGDVDGGGGGNRGGGNTRVTTGGGGGGGSRGGGGSGVSGGGRIPVGGGSGGINFSRSGLMGGATNIAGMAYPLISGVQNITEGKNLEGAGNIAGGVTALAATRGMNPLLRLGAAGLASMGVGALGAAGDRNVAEKTGRGSDEYAQEKQRYQMGQTMNTMLAGIQDISKTQLENDILRMKAQEPFLNRMLDKQLVRQQAMNASLTNSYAMLGTLATAGKMAQQGQREAGANFRTALQSNPYAGSVVQAPSISF
jgi:hypothetical protein